MTGNAVLFYNDIVKMTIATSGGTMANTKGFLTIEELVERTKVPADTIRRWSSRGIIWKAIRIFFGRLGCRACWPEEVVEQSMMVRRCIKEGGLLIEARALVQKQFGDQPSMPAPTEMKLLFMDAFFRSDIDEMGNVVRLLPDELRKNHEAEIRKVENEKMLGYALDFESAVRKEIRKGQKKPKKTS